MIATKSKVVGVDIPIQAVQNYLYVQLKKKWGMADADYKCYGRIYKNQTADGYNPEAFMGAGNTTEYADTFIDDTCKVNSFFILGDSQKYQPGLGLVANVGVIFGVNVLQVKPGYAWRADEEVRLDVEILLKQPRFGMRFESVETGIDNVFREISGWNKKKGIQYMDMQPLHFFRINLVTQPYAVSIC